MNKLTSTQTFKDIMKATPNLIRMISPDMLNKYVIPLSFYEDKFKALSTKKYALVRPTLKAAKANKIHLFNFSDPFNSQEESSVMPDYYTAFGYVIRDGKGSQTWVNAAKKTGYMRNSDKEPVALRTNETALYAYLQTGYTSLLLLEHDAEITNNIKLQTYLAEFYGTLMSYVFDRIYPISGELDSYTRLTFLCALYYLQVMAGYDLKKALNIAIKLKNVDAVTVAEKSRAFAEASIEMKNFDDLIKSLEIEFPFIKKGSMTLRSIVAATARQFGPSSIFAVEHSQSFINMIQSVGLKANFYRDDVISKLIPSVHVDEVNRILLLISGE